MISFETLSPRALPAESLPSAVGRGGRRAVTLLATSGLLLLLGKGRSSLSQFVPLLAVALCLVGLALVARPSPDRSLGVFAQLAALGVMGPLFGLAVVGQSYYSEAILGGSGLSEAWRSAELNVWRLLAVRWKIFGLVFVLAASSAASSATYAFAPGQRHLRALWVLPLPSVVALLVAERYQIRDEGLQPSVVAGGLGLYALGIISLTLAWSILFALAERFGPRAGPPPADAGDPEAAVEERSPSREPET